MKTTYKYKNGANGEEEFSEGSKRKLSHETSQKIVNSYLRLNNTSKSLESQRVSSAKDADENIAKSISEATKQAKSGGSASAGSTGAANNATKSGKKSSKLPIVIAVVAVLAVIVAFGLNMVKSSNQKKLEARRDAFVGNVEALFTDDTESDVIDGITLDTVEPLYNEIEALAKKGIDLSKYNDILSNIQLYVGDKEIVSKYDDPSVNVISFENDVASTIANLQGIVESEYTVYGLQVTMATRCGDILARINDYYSIKDMMESELINHEGAVDLSGYIDMVNGLYYDNMKDNLSYLFEVGNAVNAVVDAENQLVAVNVPVENEGVEDKKLKKAERKARDEAIAARDAAVASAQEVLNEKQAELDNAWLNYYSSDDALEGLNRGELYLEGTQVNDVAGSGESVEDL